MNIGMRSVGDRREDMLKVMTIITRYAKAFLEEEIGLRVINRAYHCDDIQKIELKSMTSLVAVGGDINMFIAFSFETPLITAIARRFTEGLEISEHENDLYIRETASEVINTIIGNSTADLTVGNNRIGLSPPVVVSGARSVFRAKNAKFSSVSISSKYGDLDINFVGPKELFDESLNYIGSPYPPNAS